ncbi:MAG TPA: hypothetical protein PK400_03630 [Phycisphaerales bacterium]|nr:hypothetical protein [Phycisphaerales bacterium]HRQ74648.1 hypothetical protein [Phycisphaerales bacterium]
MPDPRELKPGDRVRFIAIPEEWSQPNVTVPEESHAFMKEMIKRRFSSRVDRIDEYGHPWIEAKIKVGEQIEWHSWAITELTGWRKVKKRK